jgi:hypothetical protein
MVVVSMVKSLHLDKPAAYRSAHHVGDAGAAIRARRHNYRSSAHADGRRAPTASTLPALGRIGEHTFLLHNRLLGVE